MIRPPLFEPSPRMVSPVSRIWFPSGYVRRNSNQLSYRRETRATLSVEMLSYCCTNNAKRSLVSLRTTFSNYHFLFGYVHSFVLLYENTHLHLAPHWG